MHAASRLNAEWHANLALNKPTYASSVQTDPAYGGDYSPWKVSAYKGAFTAAKVN